MTFRALSLLVPAIVAVTLGTTQAQTPHNLILFVPDGMRAAQVSSQVAPAWSRFATRRQFCQPAFAIPDLYNAEFGGPLNRSLHR
jgi:hypothetical protein